MELRNKFFAGTFVGIMCSIVCFVGLSGLSDDATLIAGIALATFIAVAIVVSIALYKVIGDSWLFLLWPLTVLAVPCLLTLYFSVTYALKFLGVEYVAAGVPLWLLILSLGYLSGDVPQRPYKADNRLPLIAAAGAVVPSVLSAVGILDRKAFILVFCNYTLACGLAFVLSGFSRTVYLHLRTARTGCV